MPIQDSANNDLAGPVVGQMLGFTEPAESTRLLPLNMYNFLINPIRQADARTGPLGGNLFVKRYLTGPQAIWEQMQALMFSVLDIWDVTRCPDRLLKYLKNMVGWTDELAFKAVTDQLTDAELRKLVSNAVALWKLRGKEESYEAFLSVIIDARIRTWNWFDLRWILDETIFGEDHQGRDPWLLSTVEENHSDIRIVDDGTLNRPLLLAMLALFRPGGERLNVYWITFLDQFLTANDDTQWESATDPLTIADRMLQLTDNTQPERAHVIVDGFTLWTNYVAYWRLRGSGDGYGAVFLYSDDDNTYRFEFFNDAGTLVLRLEKVIGGVASELARYDAVTFYDDVFYGLRVQVYDNGAGDTLIRCYWEGEEVITYTDSTSPFNVGTIGVHHLDNSTVDLSEVEMYELPLDHDLIDINEHL